MMLERHGLVTRNGKRGGWKPRYCYERVYRALLEQYRQTHAFVPNPLLADMAQRSIPTTRCKLCVLESAGLVVRRGQRGGWKPRRNDSAPAAEKVLDKLSELHYRAHTFIPTEVIARELRVTAAHIRAVLTMHERAGAVVRYGQRGGWVPAGAI